MKNFFEQVYDIVEQIPPGKVMSYGQIADQIGNGYSARYVGFAMSSAPAMRKLPCHRVVNRLGEMAPGLIFDGAHRQRELLEQEGVIFKKNGRIDMALCRFEPGEEM